MKKITNIFLFIMLFISFAGFRGCESFFYGLFGIDANSLAFALAFGGSDNVPVHYGVAVTGDRLLHGS